MSLMEGYKIKLSCYRWPLIFHSSLSLSFSFGESVVLKKSPGRRRQRMTYSEEEKEGVMPTGTPWVWICRDGIVKIISVSCGEKTLGCKFTTQKVSLSLPMI